MITLSQMALHLNLFTLLGLFRTLVNKMGTKYYFLSKLYITVVVADESVDETYWYFLLFLCFSFEYLDNLPMQYHVGNECQDADDWDFLACPLRSLTSSPVWFQNNIISSYIISYIFHDVIKIFMDIWNTNLITTKK